MFSQNIGKARQQETNRDAYADGFQVKRTRCLQLAGLSKTDYRYISMPKNDVAFRDRLLKLATHYPRYGYLMLNQFLK